MYPNEVNIVVLPITKELEIIKSIQVCLISWMNFGFKENGGKKSFSCKWSINIVYSIQENMIVLPIEKRIEIITSIQV